MLDDKSLVLVSQVSQRWYDIISSSRKLRAKLKSILRRIKNDKENSTIPLQKKSISKKRKRQATDHSTQQNKKRNLRF